jgi:hypothetical protein
MYVPLPILFLLPIIASCLHADLESTCWALRRGMLRGLRGHDAPLDFNKKKDAGSPAAAAADGMPLRRFPFTTRSQ